jgi:hypothetical protein
MTIELNLGLLVRGQVRLLALGRCLHQEMPFHSQELGSLSIAVTVTI